MMGLFGRQLFAQKAAMRLVEPRWTRKCPKPHGLRMDLVGVALLGESRGSHACTYGVCAWLESVVKHAPPLEHQRPEQRDLTDRH
jgi:hypothetical protein